MISVYKEIFDCSPVAMLLVDEKSKIELANKHAENLFEYSSEELIGKDIDILVPEEIRAKHPKLVKDYFSAPLSRQMGVGRNLYGIKKNGNKFPVEIGLNPIQADGKLYVMSSVIDITERMKAEDRFKAAVDAAPNGMLMINGKGTIELLNRKTEEIFGYDRNELVGSPIETLVPEDFRGPHPTLVKSYISKPVPRSMGIGRELFGRHKSGKLIPVEIGLQPIYSGEDIFVISSIVDISERREAEKQIQEKSEEIKEFSYRTSHDLRSPLLSIESLADCIIEDIRDGKINDASESAQKVKKLTTKLNTLVEDILILTKADLNSEEKSIFDFNNYLSDAHVKFDFILKESNVKVLQSFLHKKELLTQKTRLTQVLDNLISNAVKYNKKRESESYVRINTFNDSKKFYIQVEDNGLGIPKNKHAEVFNMFKRFHDTDVQGSGLGLYMIKKHIQKLDGEILFESSPDGTVFYLEFAIE